MPLFNIDPLSDTHPCLSPLRFPRFRNPTALRNIRPIAESRQVVRDDVRRAPAARRRLGGRRAEGHRRSECRPLRCALRPFRLPSLDASCACLANQRAGGVSFSSKLRRHVSGWALGTNPGAYSHFWNRHGSQGFIFLHTPGMRSKRAFEPPLPPPHLGDT